MDEEEKEKGVRSGSTVLSYGTFDLLASLFAEYYCTSKNKFIYRFKYNDFHKFVY